MKENLLCKNIRIEQSFQGLFGGPKSKTVSLIINSVEYQIVIEQCMIRTIIINALAPVSTVTLCNLFLALEKLLMLMEGRFFPVSNVSISGENASENDYSEAANMFISNRLAYYTTTPAYCYQDHCFLDYQEILDADLLIKWIDLQAELDIVHQNVLYNIADTGVTTDIKCANLIEVFEPLAEIINQYENFFPQLSPGDRGTTLKMCVDAVICKYGKDIFNEEYCCNKEAFLRIIVNSRNRVMHIKRNQPSGKYLSGAESILYMTKICHLYRIVMLSILGVDYQLYHDKLIKSISAWNQWEKVLERFLLQKLL